MNKIYKSLLLSILYLSVIKSFFNDKDAYNFCQKSPDTYIAIIWPIAQGKDKKIEKIFSSWGQIKYKKIVYITPKGAFYLLSEAHPHIMDMHEHVRWYFPHGTFDNPARVYLFQCPSVDYVVKCKHQIRKLYKLQYRSIHINDYYHETLNLAKIFFKKNDFGYYYI